MKRAGFTTWVGGNIGLVLLDVLPDIQTDHAVVMELSSFQLEIMSVSPHTAAVLNITPNHLDRHGTMEAYTLAKAQILLHQRPGDWAVLAYDDPISHSLERAVIGELVWFSRQTMIADGAFLAGERLVVAGDASFDGEPHVICSRADIPLRGDHNVSNVLAACAISGVNRVQPEVMAAAVRDFKAVAHRLEVVRVLDGVTYINDSIATAPERVLAALHSFTEPLLLLLGGKDKKLPWDDMLRLALTKARQIIAFGGDAADIVVETAARLTGNLDAVQRVADLDEAVALASRLAQPGDVVLLSPGGTSYDAYRDFEARGEHFRLLVMGL
jgi:UDP-N-acetylmuramoylalanine--D-glutamate ligase